MPRGGRVRRTVCLRGHPVHPPETRRERTDALHTDSDADRGHRPVGRKQQGGRPLQSTGQQVLVRRFTERGLEAAAEVGRRQRGGRGHVGHSERLGIAGVREIPGTEQMTSDRSMGHGPIVRSPGAARSRSLGGRHGASRGGRGPASAERGSSPRLRISIDELAQHVSDALAEFLGCLSSGRTPAGRPAAQRNSGPVTLRPESTDWPTAPVPGPVRGTSPPRSDRPSRAPDPPALPCRAGTGRPTRPGS